MNFLKRVTILALIGVGAAGAFRLTSDIVQQGGVGNYWESRQKAAEIRDAMALVNAFYVEGEQAELDALTESALEGLVSGLDPYSEFLSFEQFKALDEETRQEFGGIGVQVEMRDEVLTVVAPLNGSPGERAGLLRGDRIVGVDGDSIEGLGITEAVSRLKGRPGTQVAIQLEREGESDPLDIDVTRELIQVDNVHGAEMVEEGLGYVRISQFGKRTGEELEEAIDQLIEQGMRGLVLDLRNNPGGLLEAAVEVVGQFVPDGQLVVFTKGRHAVMNEEWFANNSGAAYTFPLVVLVNPGSASASEIVAGALKDSGRAELVGETTFGKGSVQSILPLSGSTGIKLTTAKYYTPGGYVIHDNGIEPDVMIEISPKEEGNLYIQRSRLKTMPLEEFVKRYEFEPIEDRQLNAALDLLRDDLGES